MQHGLLSEDEALAWVRANKGAKATPVKSRPSSGARSSGSTAKRPPAKAKAPPPKRPRPAPGKKARKAGSSSEEEDESSDNDIPLSKRHAKPTPRAAPKPAARKSDAGGSGGKGSGGKPKGSIAKKEQLFAAGADSDSDDDVPLAARFAAK